MTTFDDRMRPRAQALIDARGKAMVIKQVAEAVYDPATGTSALTETSYSVIGVIDQPSDLEIANGVAMVNDRHVIVAALNLPIVPSPADIVTMDGEDWKVLAAPKRFSGELVAYYELRLRR